MNKKKILAFVLSLTVLGFAEGGISVLSKSDIGNTIVAEAATNKEITSTSSWSGYKLTVTNIYQYSNVPSSIYVTGAKDNFTFSGTLKLNSTAKITSGKYSGYYRAVYVGYPQMSA